MMSGTKGTYRTAMWDSRIGRRHVGKQRTRWADSFAQQTGNQWTKRDDKRTQKIRGQEVVVNSAMCSVTINNTRNNVRGNKL